LYNIYKLGICIMFLIGVSVYMYVNVMSITVINDICNDIDNYTR